MSDSKHETLQQAVTALEYHNEELIAEQLRDYAGEPDHPWLHKAGWTVKAVTLWATILGSLVIGLGGMAHSVLQGELFNAAFFLVFTFLLWAFIAAIRAMGDGLRDWFREYEPGEDDA